MQRLPPGGKKINLSLYMSVDDRNKITKRADELGMTPGFYLVNLASMDAELGLSEHLMSGGLIQLVPKDAETEPIVSPPAKQNDAPIQPGEMPIPADVKKVQEQTPKVNAPSSVTQSPQFSRPPMRSIQDLLKINAGMTIPGEQPQQPGQLDKFHKTVTKDQKNEGAFRKQILDNLPPAKDEEEGEK